MRVFIGMETSGVMRRAFAAAGHQVLSCDLLPAQDGCGFDPVEMTGHKVGDVFDILDRMKWAGCEPDLAVFHPDCTYFTVSAAWAFKDPDFVRYPGVGYHQRVKPGTLTGKARRDRQAEDLKTVKRIQKLPIKTKIVENPIGQLSSLWMKPSDIVQPYEFGDDASKATCLWALDENGDRILTKLPRDPGDLILPTLRPTGKRYWSNQTDTGQNRLSPGEDRWQKRADTYRGIAKAIVKHFTK